MEKIKSKKWIYIVCAIFVIVVAALYVLLYLFPSITGSLTPTYIVDYGTVSTTDEAKCFVVRDEEVFYAKKSGSLTYYSKETEKTRKGFVALDIYSGSNKTSYSCPSTGFVSYYIDGYEDYFVPDDVGSLQIDDYKDLEIVPKNTVRNEAQINEPVYKLIKSNTWYLLLIVPEEELSLYSMNDKISINLNDTDVITANVVRFLGDGETRVVVASTKMYYENFAKIRSFNATVTTKETSGLFVPTTAINTVNDKQGVYVLGVDEDYVFKEIEVLIDGDEYTLISDSGNIKLYDEILRNAKNDN